MHRSFGPPYSQANTAANPVAELDERSCPAYQQHGGFLSKYWVFSRAATKKAKSDTGYAAILGGFISPVVGAEFAWLSQHAGECVSKNQCLKIRYAGGPLVIPYCVGGSECC